VISETFEDFLKKSNQKGVGGINPPKKFIKMGDRGLHPLSENQFKI